MNKEIRTKEYPRTVYLHQIEGYIRKDVIKVLVGIRRSGKSVLMKQVIAHLIERLAVNKDDILYIDKEDLSFDFIKEYNQLYDHVMEINPRYLLIDEVQEIKEWEKAIASFHKKGIDVFITGSNANMLSSDLATYLAGRYVTIPTYTLSFKEYIQFHNSETVQKDSVFADYMRLGGFPILAQFFGDQQSSYILVRDIFETIVLKDIVARHNIRRVTLLHSIIRYVADNIGNTFSANKISTYLKSQKIKIDVETVQDYLGFLTSAFALHKIHRYDIQGKKHLDISEKYYLADLGLRHALLGYRQQNINQFLENIVCVELLRRGYKVSVGKFGDREIDFIAENEQNKIYIQVCYIIADKDVFSREFEVLYAIRDQYPKLVLSMDDDSYGNTFEGVQRKNIISWLLE